MDNTMLSTLITGGFAIIGSLGTLLISNVFDSIRDKRAMQERLFHNLFPERIKAHQEIVRNIAELELHQFIVFEFVPNDLSERLAHIAETADELFKRYQIIASNNVLRILTDLGTEARSALKILSVKPAEEHFNVFQKFAVRCNNLYFSLLEAARKESGAQFVDTSVEVFAEIMESRKNLREIAINKKTQKISNQPARNNAARQH